MAVVVGSEVPGAGADRGAGKWGRFAERTADAAVGASVAHPKGWVVERERFTLDGTRGYTLWEPTSDPEDAHGGTAALRVALAYEMEPRQIGRRVEEKISEFPDLTVKRRTVAVGEKKLRGTAVGPLPGSSPYWEVYVPVDGRVYQVNVYREELDAEGRKLLSSIRFDPPSRSSSSLGLPDGDEPSAYHPKGKVSEPSAAEREARVRQAEQATEPSGGTPTRSTSATRTTAATAETRIGEGCWRAPSNLGVQTQHGWNANRPTGDDILDSPDRVRRYIQRGHANVGMPNFWGAYSHGAMGYGRCTHTYYTNDMYAVDYPLRPGDAVFNPFPGGTVKHIGANSSHRDYGIFVVVQYGRYVSMTAHLSSVDKRLRVNQPVNAGTILGYSGATAYGNVPIGYPHLHQAFYRYTRFTADGSPYGGQGLQVPYHRFTGCPRSEATECGSYRPGGTHRLSWKGSDTAATLTKDERMSN